MEYKQIEGGDAILASLTLLYDPKTKKIIVQRLSQDAEELRRILDEWHPSFRDTPDILGGLMS